MTDAGEGDSVWPRIRDGGITFHSVADLLGTNPEANSEVFYCRFGTNPSFRPVPATSAAALAILGGLFALMGTVLIHRLRVPPSCRLD